jgi:branched-chain amino acid transport system ATP-binding protein
MGSKSVILRTENVGRTFGAFCALRDVSVLIPRGRLTAIIGPNGAGKSTFFNMISGALRPTEGRIFFEEREITGLPQHALARMGIAKSYQITNIFPNLTVLENVRVAAQALVSRFEIWRPRIAFTEPFREAGALLEVVGLTARARLPAGSLSHGEQRALEIAIALAAKPRLLLLDEPTAGMSPEETRVMMELIVKLARERTVVLVEHKMKLVMNISDHVIVLHHGEVLAEGSPDEIRANEEVKRVYLGQGQPAEARRT